jgi:hypothetical protein
VTVPGEPPALRVIRGDATPEEIAALVAALFASAASAASGSASPAAAGAPGGRPARSAWSDRSRLVRAPVHPGPGAWRRSALPG